MLELVSNVINGSELQLLFSNSIFTDTIFYDKVIYGPSEALKIIQKHYGVSPSMDGNNILDISIIRDHLYNICSNKTWINGFTITAPHTHWPDKKAVIYQYEPNKNIYTIGPHNIIKSAKYTPVSFVFSDELPLPYEWAHESVMIDKLEWASCYNLICQLNTKIRNKNIPLGIAIDFRFRTSLFNLSQPSLEIPIEDDENDLNEFSYIVNSPGMIQKSELSATEQVSWHPISELSYQFSEEETVILNQLRLNLNALDDPYAQERLITELQTRLEEKSI